MNATVSVSGKEGQWGTVQVLSYLRPFAIIKHPRCIVDIMNLSHPSGGQLRATQEDGAETANILFEESMTHAFMQ